MKGCLNLIWLKVLYVLYVIGLLKLLYASSVHVQKKRNLWRQLCAWLSHQNVMLPSNLEPQTALLGLWNNRCRINAYKPPDFNVQALYLP